jgi:hypothetical protein
VGDNLLRDLPAEIITLPRLVTLMVHPNPFQPLDEGEFVYVHTHRYNISTLTELSLRSFVTVDVDMEIPQFVHAYMRDMTDCLVCNRLMLEPLAHVWIRMPIYNLNVPFNVRVCSNACLRRINNFQGKATWRAASPFSL